MPPVRVLWLTKGLGRGGAERLLHFSLPYVDPERLHVEVAYLLPWKDALVADIREHGVPVHCLGRHRRDPLWLPRLRRLVRDRRFDIVHTHSPLPAVAVRLALGRRCTIVHTEHNVWPQYRWVTSTLNAATFRRNAAAIAVSGGVADSMVPPAWMPWARVGEVEVLHHGIDARHVRVGDGARATARRILGLGEDELVIGTVGNFTAKKDQRSLVSAAATLTAERPDLRLVLVGGGPLEQELRVQAAAAGLGDRVLFAGSRDDVQTILPAFDVFVLSSLYEGLSIALVEAMAAGLPCVATRVGGVPEVYTDGVEGLIVEPGDQHGLVEALRRLLADPLLRERMGAAAARTAGRFSIEQAVRRTEQLYDQVLSRQPASR